MCYSSRNCIPWLYILSPTCTDDYIPVVHGCTPQYKIQKTTLDTVYTSQPLLFKLAGYSLQGEQKADSH
jgi:hypothetical protein